jgi:hypothetical protein
VITRKEGHTVSRQGPPEPLDNSCTVRATIDEVAEKDEMYRQIIPRPVSLNRIQQPVELALAAMNVPDCINTPAIRH